jgi:hemerythrin
LKEKIREKEMGNIEKIEWEKKYSVDVEEIDIHQKKMFELFNQLIDMKSSNTDIKDCINVITEINEYSKLYFSTEEKYLKKKGYPDFHSHAKAHRKFAKISISLRREISENEDSLTLDVIEEMRNWLINHILTRDTLYIPFLRINQYIEDSKKKN